MSPGNAAPVREAFEAMVTAIGADHAHQDEWGRTYLTADVEWHEDPGLPGATARIGRSPAGQVPTEYRWAFVVRVRAGKLGFVRAFLSRDEALESVGLPAAG